MSVIITNVSRAGTKRCRYHIKINANIVMEFTHIRSDGLAMCLRRAADAVDKYEAEKFVRLVGTMK